MSQGVNICEGEEANIWALIEGGDSTAYNVTWYEDMLYGPLVTPTSISNDTSYADFIPTDSSWYFVQLQDGCSSSVYDSVFVGVVIPEPITVLIDETFGCAPLTATITVQSSDAAVYNYDFDCDGSFDINSTNSTETFTYTQEGVYDVCVTTVNAFGCFSHAEQLNAITVWPTPNAYFTSSENSVSIFKPGVDFTDQSSGNTINTWHFGEEDTISGPFNGPIDLQATNTTYGTYNNPTHQFSEPGSYNVSLIVSNIYGCKDTALSTIVVNEEYGIYVPNTITVNGDGKNDIFYVNGTGITSQDYLLQIFDRWGLLIFETDDPLVGWDGTYKGEVVIQDTYVWKVHAVHVNQEEHDLIGHVNVIR